MPPEGFNGHPFQSLESSLNFLEERGELIRFTRRVNPRFELAAIIKNVQQTINRALLFENVEGFPGKVASNLGGSFANLAAALSANPRRLARTWAEKCASFGAVSYPAASSSDLKPLALKELPAITFHDKDAGPYITGGVVLTKNPANGKINLSFHRVQMTGTDEFGIRLSPSGHLFASHQFQEERNQPLECALLIGNSPLTMLAAATTISGGESELDLASHLLGHPWPLRRCQTVDLSVPADSEIVIEGEILPHVRRDEGPFGEWMGYYVAKGPNHVFKARNIFGRRRPPLFYTLVAGSSEELLLTGIPIAGSIFRAVQVFVPSVLDVVCWPMPQFCLIQLKKRYDGEERRAILAAMGAELNRILFVIALDEDVNIYDPADVMWALSTRCRPDRDIFIVPEVPSFARDPFQRHWGRIGLDATVPVNLVKDFERKKISDPAQVRWEEYV